MLGVLTRNFILHLHLLENRQIRCGVQWLNEKQISKRVCKYNLPKYSNRTGSCADHDRHHLASETISKTV